MSDISDIMTVMYATQQKRKPGRCKNSIGFPNKGHRPSHNNLPDINEDHLLTVVGSCIEGKDVNMCFLVKLWQDICTACTPPRGPALQSTPASYSPPQEL
mmetsp:Transcript_46171/g.81249  ORF Transcript_46171/g.81249 Transcript_46171/m.81249 type:complete len:100 (-) Transcript_46171:235-534(-)